MRLGKKQIGEKNYPYFIAEMSGNHNQSLDRALRIVEAAAEAGADAIKLQTYTPDTMTIDYSEREFFIADKSSLWSGKSLYQLYQEAMTPWDWHKPIFKRCQELGLDFLSTPFDDSAVDLLESLNVPFYKIASFENNYFSLIKRVAKTGKPTLISLGMTTLSDIEEIVKTYKSAGGKDLVLLKCTSAYPAKPSEANLATIRNIKDTFQVEVGLSDHTLGHSLAIMASALGASVIEKHFTLSRAEGGVDSAFSMEPGEFKEMIAQTKMAIDALGSVRYGLTADEEKSKVFKRSVYFVKDVQEGEVLSKDHLRVIRPGLGLEPKHFDSLIGRRARSSFKRGTAVSWDKII